MINEYILGVPKPTARPRASSRHGKAFIYNPDSKAMKEWKLQIDASMSRHANKGLEGAMKVTLEFYLPRPKSHFRAGKYSHLLKADAPDAESIRADVDNLAKAVLDRMTASGYINDDRQITELTVTKEWNDLFDAGCRVTTEVL